MNMVELESGLVVPKEKQPERRYGPLELVDVGKRKRARSALQELFFVASSGRIPFPGDEANPSRQRLLMALAVELLGEDDANFCELT